MTTLLGCMLWLLAGWAFVACTGGWRAVRRQRPALRALWAILLVGAGVLLFRPEEEMTAGEDAGAYLNTAFSHARHGTLALEDPALAELDPSRRPLFQYREAGYGLTKDLCFWIKDMQAARVGPWFHPAFPLLLGLPAALGFPYGAFWVVPLFAIMSAMVLAELARRLTGKERMAVAAFVLFLLHPAMVWNARCLRPEIPAGFFLLAGIAILTSRPPSRSGTFAAGLLGGLSFPVAVLLHITAAYVTIPALLVAAWLTRREHFWGGWWCGFAAGLAVLALQVLWVTDPYGLAPLLTHPERGRLIGWMAAGFFCLLVAIVARPWLLRRILPPGSAPGRPGLRSPERALGMAAALGYLFLVAWVFTMRDAMGNVPGLPRWLTPYLSLTDFHGVASLSSTLWSITALVGVVALCGAAGEGGTLGRRIFFMLGPATLTIGWMINYMFETRRTTMALVPLMVLAAVALIDVLEVSLTRMLPKRFRISRAFVFCIPCLAALLLTGAALRGRAPLYQLWNRKGTFAFYRDVSRQVIQEGDFIFAEYTQTAAPIEHLTGLPLLPLAWEHRSESEYRQAEAAMVDIVRRHPDRRHLFVSPFSGMALPGLAIEPLFTRTLQTRILERSKIPVPTAILDRTLTMHVSRVTSCETTAHDEPYVRMMDGSHLGASGAANFMRHRSIELEGIPVAPHAPASLRLPAAEGASERPRRIALVFAVPSMGDPATLAAEWDGQAVEARRYPLCPGWQVLEIDRRAATTTSREIRLTASEPVYLTDILPLDEPGEGTGPWKTLHRLKKFRLKAFDSQWFRAEAALALPALSGPGRLWIHATNGREDGVSGTLSMRPADRDGGSVDQSLRAGWRWHVLPLPASTAEAGVFEWHDMRVKPAWDPGLKDFPRDLGLRIHAVVATARTGERLR